MRIKNAVVLLFKKSVQNIIFQIGDIKYIIDSPYIIHYPLENKNKPAVHIKVGKNCYGDKIVCRVDIYL